MNAKKIRIVRIRTDEPHYFRSDLPTHPVYFLANRQMERHAPYHVLWRSREC